MALSNRHILLVGILIILFAIPFLFSAINYYSSVTIKRKAIIVDCYRVNSNEVSCNIGSNQKIIREITSEPNIRMYYLRKESRFYNMNKTNKEADMVTVYFGVFGFITLLGVALIVFRHRLADQKLFIFNGDDLDD